MFLISFYEEAMKMINFSQLTVPNF